jgi:transcriptional regulator with XRE-family HTH domain
MGGSMKTTKRLLGARIKELRKAAGLSQEQLAEQILVDPKFISRIEVGKSAPSLETMEKISHALKIEIRELFEFMHLEEDLINSDELKSLIQDADEETRKVLLKFMRALMR